MEWEAFIPDPPPKPDEADNILFVSVFLSEDFWISAVDMSSVDSEELEKTLFSGLLTGHCQSASSRVKVQHSSEFSVSAFSSLSKFLIWIEQKLN